MCAKTDKNPYLVKKLPTVKFKKIHGKEHKIMNEKKKVSTILKMIVGSLLGLIIFIVPLDYGDGKPVLLISLARRVISENTGGVFAFLGIIITGISLAGAIYYLITKEKEHNKFFMECFSVSILDLIWRVLAFGIAIFGYYKLGPEFIWSEFTGGLLVWDVMPALFIVFLIGITCLPFLTDYGLMELVGGVLRPIFRPLFRLPGRSAALCISAWFGNGTTAIVATDFEYQRGYLTARESAIICMNFCVIVYSAMFTYSTVIGGLEDMYFGALFLTCTLIGIVSTAILSRIPPISKYPDTYFEGKKNIYDEDKGGLKYAFEQAYEKVTVAPAPIDMVKNGVVSATKLYMILYPTIIAMATVVLIIAEYTPVFDYIAMPFVPLLNLLGVPEAPSVAPALFTGLADLLLPFIAATRIQSQLSKFILCALGVTQLICLSESALIMMKSKIPFKFSHMFTIFLEKTAIGFIIALVAGRLIGLT